MFSWYFPVAVLNYAVDGPVIEHMSGLPTIKAHERVGTQKDGDIVKGFKEKEASGAAPV